MKRTDMRRRALSPKQLRAIELRLRGLDLTAIAQEVGQHRVTVSRWFNGDGLVIAELAERLRQRHDQELRRQISVRQKAMSVVEAAVDAGDVRTALAVLRLSIPAPAAPQSMGTSIAASPAEGTRASDPADPGGIYAYVSPTGWQVYIDRAQTMLSSAAEVADDRGALERFLLLHDAAGVMLLGLESAQGEGLVGFASLDGAAQAAAFTRAGNALDQALNLVLGLEEDDEDAVEEMTWRGDKATDQGLTFMGEALLEALGALQGVAEALPRMSGPEGERIAARLVHAATSAKEVMSTSRRRTPAARAERLELLTDGFKDLVTALFSGGTLEAAWD